MELCSEEDEGEREDEPRLWTTACQTEPNHPPISQTLETSQYFRISIKGFHTMEH